ncbi:MAG: HYR domain-containing protein [Chloroflexi bacterium]|nr:HYR domain-containing protein [Chloroflexota bacterium]
MSFSGTDAGSGIASCTAPVTLSTEGSGQSASGTCTDNAGNISNTASVNNINIDKTQPVIVVPANITNEATGASGATVNYTTTVSDNLDGGITVSCSPASGSTFAIGTTTVTCSTTDSADNTDSGSFTVTVEDTTSPIITVPANITKEATGSTGALVTFTASASDIVDGALTTTCSPASGLTFAIGTTTVTCSASDSAGNTSSSTFNIQITDVEKNNKSLITLFGFAPLLIPVTGGQPTDLTCFNQYTTLGMADFKVVFSNLCGYSTILANALEDSLFGALPKNVNFVSGLDIVLLHNNAPVHTIPVDGSITISIDIPSGMKGETLAILFWDTAAGAWVEKNATIESGKMVLTIDTLGTFVLVDKSTPSAMNGALDIADILNGFYLAMTDFFKQFAGN